ncbi:MAG: hypothetical protein Q4C06_07395, partial [Bacillota bacterium]|nr:hypothetical protein [Bacillota bacterium]
MELSMQLQQKQTLNRRQQQSVEILQMNALALSDYAKEAAEENPLLEWEEAAEPAQHHGAYGATCAVPEVRTEGESLRSFLLFQINTKKMPEGHKAVLRFLAESTAESGYLEADAIAVMREKFPMQEKTAARILSEFQQLEPAGVGARDLRECLCIQLKRKGASPLACRLAEVHLEEIAKNRLSYLAKTERVTMAEILAALEEIRECNPKPGSGFAGERPVEYILPDILVEQKNGVLTVSVNGASVPRLSVNYSYKALLQEQADAEAEHYLAEKQKQAEWMLECIRRRESTLRQVAEIIIKRQRMFFTEQKGAL